jgi:hypothetical protein
MSIVVGRRRVPLKNRCSRKWARPAVVADSSREPARTMRTTPTLRLKGMGASSSVTPLGRRVTVGVATSDVMGDKCDGSAA